MAADLPPVVATVTVPCAPADAFRYFTQDIGQWWPLARHSVTGRAALTCAFDGGAGGRLVERSRDGVERVWGTVTAWDPLHAVAFTWHPGRDAVTAQSVEVRFARTTAARASP